MSFIDNGMVRLGVDLNLGGAITYLSRSGAHSELNIINSHDWERQAQLSYYSGPVPFQPKGARMAKEWSQRRPNPIPRAQPGIAGRLRQRSLLPFDDL